LLGDLINRGPDNLQTLNDLISFGSSAVCLLGNHDIHFLGIERGQRKIKNGDTVSDLLNAPNKDELVYWLRTRPLAIYEHDCLMVHAGVYPSWSVDQTLALAKELETLLSGQDWQEGLSTLFANTPSHWSDDLTGMERMRSIANALTRMRFCSASGVMEFTTKGAAKNAPTGFYPWFAVPNRQTQETLIAFGHWSALNPADTNESLLEHNVISLDTGCVWGGCLTAVEIGSTHTPIPIQVKCETNDSSIQRQR
jgi:bis(5'-nucleosyl)-tetraphosphatase (symmetrical)